MGLLTSGIKYGGIFIAAREGVRALERHNDKKNTQHALQQQQSQMMPQQYPSQQPHAPYQQSRDMSGPYQDYPQQFQAPSGDLFAESSGSFHQVWCNGRCGGKCGGKEALMALSQQQQGVDAKPPPAY